MITQFLTFYGPPTFVLPWLCWLPTPKTCCLKCNLLFCFMLMITFYSLHARAHTHTVSPLCRADANWRCAQNGAGPTRPNLQAAPGDLCGRVVSAPSHRKV